MLARRISRADIVRIVLAWIVGLLALLVVCLAVAVDRFGQEDRARRSDVIVVLGSGVEADGTPTANLRARVDHAVALWRAGWAPRILFTGARFEDTPVSQAESARTYARSLGVPESALFVETTSRHTTENAKNAVEIMRAHGWRTALVTSDPYHLLRARQCFRRYDLEVSLSPVRDTERNRFWPERVFWTLREVAAMLVHPDLLVRGPASAG